MSAVPNLPSNASNQEIINHIRHHYPKLGPALQQLLDRFQSEEIDGGFEENEHEDDKVEQIVHHTNENAELTCPHCGTELELKIEDKDTELAHLAVA